MGLARHNRPALGGRSTAADEGAQHDENRILKRRVHPSPSFWTFKSISQCLLSWGGCPHVGLHLIMSSLLHLISSHVKRARAASLRKQADPDKRATFRHRVFPSSSSLSLYVASGRAPGLVAYMC